MTVLGPLAEIEWQHGDTDGPLVQVEVGMGPTAGYAWTTRRSAERWAKSHGRSIILSFGRPDMAHPLPHPKGGAMWSPNMIHDWSDCP